MNDQDWQQLQEEITTRNRITQSENGNHHNSKDAIAFHVQMILKELGQNLEDENLIDTPQRVAKYLLEFLNYNPGNHETTFESIIVDQMVIVRNIPFWSLCSHHLLFFHGHATVAYLTDEKVIGLSKIPRIVQKHAHKLQLQERLAHDIADEVENTLKPRGVAVIVKAEHSCMQARGIKSEGDMITSILRGQFRDETDVRIEFFNLLNS